MQEDLQEFRRLLRCATAAIDGQYFMLPVAGADGDEPILRYRERVYAYELYHQLRLRWPNWRYSLGGEVDKRGHPIIRDGVLKNVKPDLLSHVPGCMDYNLAVIEIKALRLEPYPDEATAIRTDLEKLIEFRNMANGYAAAFLLVFGEAVERVLDYGRNFRQACTNIELVELHHHRRAGEPAVTVEWWDRGC